MKYYKLTLLVVVFLSMIGCSETTLDYSVGSSDLRLIPATIIRVVDGDTMKVKLQNGNEETLRLLLVDTPETVHPSKPIEPYGREASDYAKKMLDGQEVGLEIDVSERDKYGRLLVYLWIDGMNFNKLLLEQGLARVAYVYPPNVKYVDQFREVQSKAQIEATGIWSIENYVQEDGFNSEDRSNAEEQEQEIVRKGIEQNSGSKVNISNIRFIASKNSDIYHELDCPGGARQINESNTIYFDTEEVATDSGRRMCHSTSCKLK